MSAIQQPMIYQRIDYPESDGSLIAESDRHRDEMFDLIDMLRDRYREAPDVYVAGNLFIYYEQGNPSAVFAPDVFVVFGVPDGDRRVYKLWEEQRAPDVVFELSSRSTWLEDKGNKKALCAHLGVAEYFLSDPVYEYLKPPLQGFRLESGVYRPMTPDSSSALQSERLGLTLYLEQGHLQLVDTQSGERLLRPVEVRALRRAAEAEAARLRAELDRLRRDDEG